MGKCGPCRHCGVTSTPLWRNGPPDKPVLCNACGSRWRTKGSLLNYTPLHKREAFDLEVFKVKNVPAKPREEKFQNRKQSISGLESKHDLQCCDQNFLKTVKADPSNRSSAGSIVSYSESCAYFGTTDASDITGPAQSNVWDSLVPSKKRTFVARAKPTPVEKLTKELYSILHEQQSNLSSSDGDLLYESGTQLDSSEIGYGGLLIKNPNCKYVEDESEASSFPVDNKSYVIGEVYSTSSLNNKNKEMSLTSSGADKLKNCTVEEVCENAKRDNSGILSLLQDRNSPLSSVDLSDIINFEVFVKYLTEEDQQQLMKHLPSLDTSRPPESLKCLFKSAQYLETVSCFQQMLQVGVFDLSSNVEDGRILKRHILLDERKSVWVEIQKRIKDKTDRQRRNEKRAPSMLKLAGDTNLLPQKRPNSIQTDDSSELEGVMKSPKRICNSSASYLPTRCSAEPITSTACWKLMDEIDGIQDREEDYLTPRSPSTSPAGRTSMLARLQFTADSSVQDVLLHLPRRASFPEAEILCLPCKEKGIPGGFPKESEVEGEESLSNFPCASFTSRQAVIK